MSDELESLSIIELSVDEDDAELVCDALWSFGVAAIEERHSGSGTTILRTSLGSRPDVQLGAIRANIPTLSWRFVSLPRAVVETWRQHVTVTMVNQRIALVPAWIDAPEVDIAVRIDPFDTFGLGNHPTTILAARMAEAAVPQASRVLDLGCGSGVLAVLMALVSDARIEVNDIADGCRAVVEHNARLNNVNSGRIRWSGGLGSARPRSLDLVVANILAPVLKAEALRIRHALADGGRVILSGMRDEQVADVLSRYEPYDLVSRETLDGWTAVTLALE